MHSSDGIESFLNPFPYDRYDRSVAVIAAIAEKKRKFIIAMISLESGFHMIAMIAAIVWKPAILSCGTDFCGSLAFLCVSRELILRLGQIGVSCWELIFADFQKVPDPALIIFSFLLSMCNRNI